MLVDSIDSVFGLVPTLKRIETGVDVSIFNEELFQADGTLQNASPSREWPHREAFHIFLRGVSREALAKKDGFHGAVTTSIDTPTLQHYPKIKAWAETFAHERRGQLERMVIAALAPHKQVYRHADRGYYFAPRDRYHLVLKSDGSWMRIAGQEETLKEGEVWWLNNKAGHESFNDSDNVRIHLIVDIYPHSVLRRVKNYLRWVYLGLRPNRLTNYYINWPKRHMATS
jgi:aspartyl/asparaginyl beta-hydroxylase (cupin superfamily)